MSYAVVLIYVDVDKVSRERIRLAAGLADKFNAKLVGMSAMIVRSPVVAEGVAIAAITESDIHDVEERLGAVAKSFRTFAGREDVEWRQAIEFPDDALPRAARGADLIVIGQSQGLGNAYCALDSGTAVLTAGRPVLVVPDGIDHLKADHVMIGWKDTREARRALRDALPFCHEAERVTVMEICEPGAQAQARDNLEDVVGYLARHRVKAKALVFPEQGGSAGTRLTSLAKEQGADLLVTGSYGHGRLREWFFGGVTRELIKHSPMCCLMSH